ncbi:ribosome biogenesis protein bop1-like [Ornithodoros turicata]|uniref:ribosome biogenesis protein bop1-like n=1 Tax=Ornithodoros turicata TaxID=34597 RepID=UPI003138A521
MASLRKNTPKGVISRFTKSVDKKKIAHHSQDEEDTDSSVYSDLEENDDAGSSSEEGDPEGGRRSSTNVASAHFGSSDSADEEDEQSGADSESDEETKNITFLGGEDLKTKEDIEKLPPNVPTKRSAREHKKGVDSTKGSTEETPVAQVDEYAFDSSDEEDIRNTIGNIPVEWYENYPHIGYDLDGKRILKPPKGDELDEFLKKMDDANYWRTVKDKSTGQQVVLTDEDVDLIQRLQHGRFPNPKIDVYEKFEDIYSHEKMIHPVTNQPEHKRSFIPSKIESQMVSRMVHAIKMGWIKPRAEKVKASRFTLLWDKEEEETPDARIQRYIPAPKMKLPGHEESYNPPPEYLFTKEEEEKWREQEPEERKLNFIPRKFSSLREVCSYQEFIRERFERCLDLYLCPRQRKMRVQVNAEDLIPKLPKPKDLQPFPSLQYIVYKGHTDVVRSLTIEPSGQFFASGSDDCTVRIWEVLTGRCMKVLHFKAAVKSVAWCPNQSVRLIAVAAGKNVHIVNPGIGDKLIVSNTDTLIGAVPEDYNKTGRKEAAQWEQASEEEHGQGVRVNVVHKNPVEQVTWHAKGDYFAVVMPGCSSGSVLIHQLSLWRSQPPFSKVKGDISKVLFHPIRPYFFVASQRFVRVYNLLEQDLSKKLISNCKWLSSIAIHPKGDNVIAGSYENRLSWFDMDLSTKPYKTLRYHKKAIRQVTYHKKYPLFASASDDGTVIICHGMVYSDLMENPLIVPVKVLRGHTINKDMGVLDCAFHPHQPWIITAGADTTLRLYA